MSRRISCPICDNNDLRSFYKREQAPIHQNLLCSTFEAARSFPVGSISLVFCSRCSFIFNQDFDPEKMKYGVLYENSQYNSNAFLSYSRKLAEWLAERHRLENKTVVELGCGQGDFLELLNEQVTIRAFGFDPAYRRTGKTESGNIEFISDYFSESYFHLAADLVICRYVLQHISFPCELVELAKQAVDHRLPASVFFEVPDIFPSLAQVAFWDIYYEHCNYFGPDSLRYIFSRCGFDVNSLSSEFGGQYLWIDSSLAKHAGRAVPVAETNIDIEGFSERVKQKVDALNKSIEAATRNQGRCVIWGAGAKSCTLLSVLEILPEKIPYVVDINPAKQGTYIPCTAQEIVSPEALIEYNPQTVFIMNPNYTVEVGKNLKMLGLAPEIICL